MQSWASLRILPDQQNPEPVVWFGFSRPTRMNPRSYTDSSVLGEPGFPGIGMLSASPRRTLRDADLSRRPLDMIVTFVEAVEFATTRILRVIKTIKDEKEKRFSKRRGKPAASAPTP